MHADFFKVLSELAPSQIDGVGVFAVASLDESQRIAEGVDESDYDRLISWEDFNRLDHDLRQKIHDFCIGTPEGFIPPDNLDFNSLSIEWYLNHSCDGNVGFDQSGDFVARRNIVKGEELTYDYALAESNPNFRMRCECGNSDCRKIITGNDWKDSRFVEKNVHYMLPRLRWFATHSQSTPATLRLNAGRAARGKAR